MHFFELPDASAGTLEDALAAGAVGVQHIAFALPDGDAAPALRRRLEEHGVRATEIGEAGPVHNTLFLDNNGLLLEATWPRP